MPTTFVIADDHAFSADGISSALGEIAGFQVLGIAPNGIEAIMLIKKHRPDCAVLDLTMPGANGLEVFIEAKRWSPHTKTAIITGNSSPAIFTQLVEAGVHGIFLKNTDPEAIFSGIRDMLRGRQVIAADVARAIQRAKKMTGLTAREIEVLHGIARGQSNNQIGQSLGISAKTVDTHRTTLMRKMGVHSTATLLVRALRDGLIDV